jgi:membrane associated rhomboid family serine protease
MDDLFRQVGRYTVLSRVGSGGFSTVYRARDTNLDREVALKVMRPLLLSDAPFVERFRQEARVVANLDHPNIVPIYDYGDIEDRLCLVMKLLPGGSLADLIKQGALPWERVLRLVGQIAAALDYAHGRGLVHRDIKPENVLLDQDGNAVLADFGLVKALESGRLTTSLSGGVLGTPAYLAPEVWNGQPGTPTTDVYSLACLVFEMVTGTQLFDAPTPPATMMLHFRPPQFPAQWPEGTPAGLDRVLRQALARHPEDRYASAGALVAALAALEADPLGETYAALQAALAAEAWHEAVAVGERIVDEAPGYRDARALLERALDGRMAADRVTWAGQWQAQTERALAAADWDGALSAARRWQQLAPEDDWAAAAVARAEEMVAPTEAVAATEPVARGKPVVEKVTFAPAGGRDAGVIAPVVGDVVPAGAVGDRGRLAGIGGRRFVGMVFYRPEDEGAQAGLQLVPPVLTFVLLAVLIAVYVAEELAGGARSGAVLVQFGIMNARLFNMGQWWRLVATLFIHIHLVNLLVNLFALYAAGPEVEARYGYARFTSIYLAGGLLANAIVFAVYGDRVTALAGPEGAVYALLGALLAYFLVTWRRGSVAAGSRPLRRLFVLLTLFLLTLGPTMTPRHPLLQPVGFVVGLVLGYLLAPRLVADEDAPDGWRDMATLRRRWWVVVGTVAVLAAALAVALS